VDDTTELSPRFHFTCTWNYVGFYPEQKTPHQSEFEVGCGRLHGNLSQLGSLVLLSDLPSYFSINISLSPFICLTGALVWTWQWEKMPGPLFLCTLEKEVTPQLHIFHQIRCQSCTVVSISRYLVCTVCYNDLVPATGTICSG
jgi:hypothetical protein